MLIKLSYLSICYLFMMLLASGCTSIVLQPDIEPTGMEKYPTKQEQLTYDNFMLGRLKYQEWNEKTDIITAGFIDQRGNNNGRLDPWEQDAIAEFREKETAYFSVGAPLYDPSTGKHTTEKNMHNGVPTSNPLDYYVPDEPPMWKRLKGCYLEKKDALRFVERMSENRHSTWGVIEVNFTPLIYGKPAQVTQVWRAGEQTRKYYDITLKWYRMKPEICRLTSSDFKLIYLK